MRTYVAPLLFSFLLPWFQTVLHAGTLFPVEEGMLVVHTCPTAHDFCATWLHRARELSMKQFRPSTIATASVICSRAMLSVEPEFPISLQKIGTGGVGMASDEELGLCCERLRRVCTASDKIPATSPLTAYAKAMEGVVRDLHEDGALPFRWVANDPLVLCGYRS